jgi:hypothetical protein
MPEPSKAKPVEPKAKPLALAAKKPAAKKPKTSKISFSTFNRGLGVNISPITITSTPKIADIFNIKIPYYTTSSKIKLAGTYYFTIEKRLKLNATDAPIVKPAINWDFDENNDTSLSVILENNNPNYDFTSNTDDIKLYNSKGDPISNALLSLIQSRLLPPSALNTVTQLPSNTILARLNNNVISEGKTTLAFKLDINILISKIYVFDAPSDLFKFGFQFLNALASSLSIQTFLKNNFNFPTIVFRLTKTSSPLFKTLVSELYDSSIKVGEGFIVTDPSSLLRDALA